MLNKKNRGGLIAVLIPAYNEDKVITKTLKAVLKIVPKKDLYIVDDGSKDLTEAIARTFTPNVLRTDNHGKAHALNAGLDYFHLPDRYTYILFMDADTTPAPDFLIHALVHFKKDPTHKLVCVVGRVKTSGNNWLSKYRQWEYQVSYHIHKKAQQYLHSILVTPGCATVYRGNLFKKLHFPGGTLTEDMDFTFLMHRHGYNHMIFEPRAIVITQDPQRIRDFIKQLNRWYTGFWQVVRKHDIPWKGQMLDLEVAILAAEGLYNGLLVLLFILTAFIFLFLQKISLLMVPLFFDFCLFFLPTLIWSMIGDKDLARILYIPHFYFLRFLSSYLFLFSFFSGFLSEEKEYHWDSHRYLGKEVM